MSSDVQTSEKSSSSMPCRIKQLRMRCSFGQDICGGHLWTSGDIPGGGTREETKDRDPRMTIEVKSVPSISVSYARNGSSTKANAFDMRPMQERAYEKRGEQYLLIKSPPASGKSRALMFIALDKLRNQGLKQAIIVVPEKAIGASFYD